MTIITQKLMQRANIVPGVVTYKTYPLALFVMYDDDGLVVDSGFCPSGAMELAADGNLSYSEADGCADGYRFERAPLIDPSFLSSYDNIATRVEGE